MNKLLYRTSLFSSGLLSIMVLFFACTGNSERLPCEVDRNCLSGQYCASDGLCQTGSKPPEERTSPKDAGGGGDEKVPDKGNPPADREPPKDDNKPADRTPPKDEPKLTYPKGPYGADIGNVAYPFAIADCDGNKSYDLKDLYKHPKIKVLLVTVHTLW